MRVSLASGLSRISCLGRLAYRLKRSPTEHLAVTPPLPSETEVRIRMSSGGLRERPPYEQQTGFRCNGFLAHGTVNSIGKEAIVRARQAEMFAQRRPFVVAPQQAAAP